jgi:hypothetical protein
VTWGPAQAGHSDQEFTSKYSARYVPPVRSYSGIYHLSSATQESLPALSYSGIYHYSSATSGLYHRFSPTQALFGLRYSVSTVPHDLSYSRTYVPPVLCTSTVPPVLNYSGISTRPHLLRHLQPLISYSYIFTCSQLLRRLPPFLSCSGISSRLQLLRYLPSSAT